MAAMTREMFAQEIREKLSRDEDFLQALAAAENAGDARQVLLENGFDMSLEQVEALFADGERQVEKFLENGMDCELSEDELEDVAGGGVIRGLVRGAVSCVAAFGFGCVCGVCPPAAAATPYVVGGLTAFTTAGFLRKGW